MSKRGKLAWAVSIGGHTLLVLGIIRLCAFLQGSPNPPKAVVNLVIDNPYDGISVSVCFEEAPTQKLEPSKRPKRDDPPAPKNLADTNANASNSNNNSNPGGVVQAEHRTPGAIPLHGKITRSGASIVYVLDRSGSMARDGKLQKAIAMLKASLRQLGPDVRFQIVSYDSRPTVYRIAGRVDLALANDANIAQAEAILNDEIGEGSSRHVEGLIAGLGLRPDMLILLTDGDDLSPDDVKRIRNWNKKGTEIHAIVLGNPGADHSSLRALTGAERLHFLK